MAIINIRSILVDMLLDITPGVYELYVTMERKWIKKLIDQFMNNIYGTIIATLIYYWNFCKTLKLNKLKINPYDHCVSNKILSGLQKSILFYVDDCKLSRNYPKLNNSYIGVIRE